MADEQSNEPVNPVSSQDSTQEVAEGHDAPSGASGARRARVRLAILTGATVGAAVVTAVLNGEPGTTSVSINVHIG